MRSAFLVKTGVSTEAFVGTNAMIAFMVDLARLAAFTGVMLGKRWLHKVKMSSIQTLTGVLLLAIALALAAGLV